MRRRARTINDDSLDLLLDTICNTFGGVVFISLLVVVLLNTSSKQTMNATPSAALQSEFIKTENRRRALTKELEELRNAIATQQEINDSLASPESADLARALSQSQGEHAALVSEESMLTGEASDAQQQINDIIASSAQRDAEFNAAQQRLMELKQQIEITVDQTARTAVIPKVVMSTQPPQTFFLKGGRLYGPRSTRTQRLNAQDFEIIDRQGMQILHERAGAGVAVDLTGKRNSAVENKLRDPWLRSFYMRLFVWPDSYQHVAAVSVILDGLNIRCQIEPCEANTQVAFSSAATTGPAPVQ